MRTDTAQFEEFTELFVDSPVGQLPLLELGTRTKISHVTSLLHANTCQVREGFCWLGGQEVLH